MIELRLGGSTNASDSIARLIGVTHDLDVQQIWPQIAHEVIHPWFLEKAAENIIGQGSLAGESWNYSSEPEYAAWKNKTIGHNVVMRWEQGGPREVLYPSLTDPKHPAHYFRLTKNSVSIGTTVEYAKRLTTGGTNPFGESYPGRSLLPSSGVLNKQLITKIQRRLKDKLADRGKGIGNVRFNL